MENQKIYAQNIWVWFTIVELPPWIRFKFSRPRVLWGSIVGLVDFALFQALITGWIEKNTLPLMNKLLSQIKIFKTGSEQHFLQRYSVKHDCLPELDKLLVIAL